MTYCGMDCCKDCSKAAQCGGCEKCNGADPEIVMYKHR